jgi:hypothetical protein
MEEFHKEDLEIFRVRILDYLSYLLNNTPIEKEPTWSELDLRVRISYLIDICLDSRKEGIKFDRVKYIVEELKKLQFYYNDIMSMEQFLMALDRNDKLENLGI